MTSRIIRLAGAAVLAASVASPHSLDAQARKPITVRWLGHAAFEVTSAGGTRLLIDPFISGNPSTPDSLKDLGRYRPAAILVSHAHADHALDAKTIATSSGAGVISAYEWVNSLALPEKQARGGFVLEFADGRTLYHTGDTWLFGDVALIQEIYHPNIILLGVGGGPFTQGPADARRGVAKYFRPTTIVPMHYGTFPGLATETQVRPAFAGDKRLSVMKAGETKNF